MAILANKIKHPIMSNAKIDIIWQPFLPFSQNDFLKSNDNHFYAYDLNSYRNDINNLGLNKTWNYICDFILDNPKNKSNLLNIQNLGELYEIGLAEVDKDQKKQCGQYYTPDDVSSIMCDWLLKQKGKNVCDVGCGTGNLILSYLEKIGNKSAYKLIAEGSLYLYDNDAIALQICKTIILAKYGVELNKKINTFCVDFLDEKTKLPQNCKVIANPPYAAFTSISESWGGTETQKSTHELYAAFMEKILEQSDSSVIITPYSFLGSKKFYPLRKKMNDKNGYIVSFDNVPGNIFNGRKHGIFNTNTSNSVRAAITVVENRKNKKGFRVSPLIRFKQTERARLLQCLTLEKFISGQYQIINEENPMFAKCDARLTLIYDNWVKQSSETLGDLVGNGDYKITMPNTCRYFTTASNKSLKRGGQISLSFQDQDTFNFAYCLINSSFAYWHWRLFDGGITYPKSLLLKTPTFFKSLTNNDKIFFAQTAKEMISRESEFIITKNNVGIQENLKFPREYRDKINNRIFSILGINENINTMDIVHSNMALEVNI